jgi:hypothetical protein
LSEGWNPQGFALTALGGATQVFEIAGPGIPRLLARATTINPDNPGPAEALVFAGVPACVYRISPRTRCGCTLTAASRPISGTGCTRRSQRDRHNGPTALNERPALVGSSWP